jgi:hypothetical protein
MLQCYFVICEGQPMPPVIRIPDALYARLEKHAQGFDTPAAVIERLLNKVEGVESLDTDGPATNTSTTEGGQRDATKYLFRGKTYGKGRLVLAVVQAYVADRDANVSSDALVEAFPKQLQGSIGVVTPLPEAQAVYERTGHPRHYLKATEILPLKPSDMAVCSQWGKGNIDAFIEHASALGFEIEAA